jgi:uncharacterized membrane protein
MVTRATSYGAVAAVLVALIAFALNAVAFAGNILVATYSADEKVSWTFVHVIIAGAVILVYWMYHDGDFSRQSWREVKDVGGDDPPDAA